MKTNIYKIKHKRRIIGLLLLLAAALVCLVSCGGKALEGTKNTEGEDMQDTDGVVMLAEITGIDEYIVAEVVESEYTYGTHWVITTENTVFYGADGKRISRSDLAVGNTVQITYNGQVMLSYPPKIVATKICVK